jgi:hypothetical protein
MSDCGSPGPPHGLHLRPPGGGLASRPLQTARYSTALSKMNSSSFFLFSTIQFLFQSIFFFPHLLPLLDPVPSLHSSPHTGLKIQVMSSAADRCVRIVMTSCPIGFPKVTCRHPTSPTHPDPYSVPLPSLPVPYSVPHSSLPVLLSFYDFMI